MEQIMIGLFLGTSEGQKILEGLNQFTDNLYVSTATEYGGEILEKYSYQHLNMEPLTQEEMAKVIDQYQITKVIDASHPYATKVTDNLMTVCQEKGLLYLRYERPSIVDSYIPHPDIIMVDNYEALERPLRKMTGVIINTTGSNNVPTLEAMNLPNPIIHKVLPTKQVLSKLYDLNIPIKNIVGIYGGGSKAFNQALFAEYNAQGVIMKDSGKQGKTKEKIEAALALGMKIFIIGREKKKYQHVFTREKDIVEYIKKMGE